MADTKLSDLTNILGSEVDPDNDETYLRDHSDGAAGSKAILIAELFKSPDLIVLPAGSAADPVIAAEGDLNTGVFFAAADCLSFATGGTERGRFDASGTLNVYHAESDPTLGSNLITNGTFTTDLSSWTVGGTGSGWAQSSGTALHAAGNTDTLSQAINTTSNAHYRIAVTVAGRSAGSVVVSLGSGRETHTLSTNATHVLSIMATATGANSLVLTPSSDFNGSVDSVTAQLVTPISAPAFHLRTSSGATGGFQAVCGGAGLSNVFIGASAGVQTFAGGSCVGIGTNALKSQTTAVYNNAIGSAALTAVTTGSSNVAVGGTALTALVQGTGNVSVGNSSLRAQINGNNNVAVGYLAFYNTTAGDGSIAIGRQAGRFYGSGSSSLTQADNCIYIGNTARGGSATESNAIVIGYDAVSLGDNTVVIGNSSTTTTQLGGAVRLNNASAPTNGADRAFLYSADQAAGNACIHAMTEGGKVIKLYQQAHIADAAGGTEVATINAILAALENCGLLASA